MMTKLLIIDAEARRVLGRMPLPRLQTLQTSLATLCESSWPNIRGPEPATRLAKALWDIPPHLADLFVLLYRIADPRLMDLLQHLTAAQALAILALAGIERGDAESARCAFATMRLFESPAAIEAHLRAIPASSGGHPADARLRHAHRPAVWRAVVGLAIQTGRWDTKAVMACIKQIAQVQAGLTLPAVEPDMHRALEMLWNLGVTFLGVNEDQLLYSVRGEEHEPVPGKQLTEMLAEGRQALQAAQ